MNRTLLASALLALALTACGKKEEAPAPVSTPEPAVTTPAPSAPAADAAKPADGTTAAPAPIAPADPQKPEEKK